ncbi:MAG: helix-turn-helix domain-containing protein, partial [Bryobacteraceae bacterium]|nr:helix-turn-helix domain-containing protein [Bryobacteraceae bacterium]
APATEDKDPRFAYTLANGLQILEAFASGAAFLGNRELSDATGMRKATVSRLTRTLCSLGYLRASPATGKFELGLAVLSLGYPRLITLPIRRVAHLLLQGLADRVQGVVNIGMRDRFDIVFVESCRAVEGLATRREIGARRPIWTGYVGETYLAGLGEEARETLFEEIKAAKLTDVKALRTAVQARIKEMEKNRFCFFTGDGLHAIASTFRATADGETAFIFCLVKDSTMSKQKMLQQVPRQLWDIIGKLEESLGAPSPQY